MPLRLYVVVGEHFVDYLYPLVGGNAANEVDKHSVEHLNIAGKAAHLAHHLSLKTHDDAHRDNHHSKPHSHSCRSNRDCRVGGMTSAIANMAKETSSDEKRKVQCIFYLRGRKPTIDALLRRDGIKK